MPYSFSEILQNLTSTDIFIDLGANVGQETIPAAEMGAIVYAFEPDRDAFQIIQSKTEKYPNVHLSEKAVWDHASRLRFYQRKEEGLDDLLATQSSSLIVEKTTINKDLFYDVETIDIGEFLLNLGEKVKVLKMDVEGAEYTVLNRIFDLELQDRIEYFFVETHADRVNGFENEHQQLLDRIARLNIKNIDLGWG